MTRLSAALVAEFLGTMIMIILGMGVVGTAVLLDKDSGWMLITTGWALGVTIAVYVSGKTSGAHLNPAITLALVLRRNFPWQRLAAYWAVQVAGAFVGAAITYVDYYEAFHAFETKHQITRGNLVDGKLDGEAVGGAGVFATYPAFDNLALNIYSEILGTMMLVAAILAITDPGNQPPAANLAPLLVGFVVWSVGLSLGGLTGYAINPARDLGPRLASAMCGWGTAVFVSHDYYFWVPLVGPLLGGIAGALLYDGAIRQFLPTDKPGK